MTPPERPLTHMDSEGRPAMVDVTEKAVTSRRAAATGRIVMDAATLRALVAGRNPKGDPLQVAELAGIMAAKRTPDLIPLCHALPGGSYKVRTRVDESLPGIVVEAEASIAGQTGVEMEALTAVSVALLTLYDMAKALDRGMRIEGIRLEHKEGGRTGTWTAAEDSKG